MSIIGQLYTASTPDNTQYIIFRRQYAMPSRTPACIWGRYFGMLVLGTACSKLTKARIILPLLHTALK